MRYLILLAGLVVVCSFTACGIAPPTENLNMAKAAIAKAEEAKADRFAVEEYKAANDNFASGESTMVKTKNKKNEEAKKKFGESQKQAEAAYVKAAPAYAQFSIDEAGTVKKSADEIKAAVAVKEQYEKAQALLNEASAAKTAGNYEEAWTKAGQAKSLFDEVYKVTVEKKTSADDALRNADSAIKKADEKQGGGE
jgi:hypothetical protein